MCPAIYISYGYANDLSNTTILYVFCCQQTNMNNFLSMKIKKINHRNLLIDIFIQSKSGICNRVIHQLSYHIEGLESNTAGMHWREPHTLALKTSYWYQNRYLCIELILPLHPPGIFAYN